VRLVGPEKSLARIDSVTTVPMEITSVSGEFTRYVPIDTMPLGIVRLSPKQVTVTGDMGRIAERSFAGIPVESGGGAITSFIVTPARVSVAIRGPEERVQAMTRDSLRVVAHITGTSGGSARITVIAPRGITARAIPDSVMLRRRGTPPRPTRRG
jgi:YbbR domain-containing protein